MAGALQMPTLSPNHRLGAEVNCPGPIFRLWLAESLLDVVSSEVRSSRSESEHQKALNHFKLENTLVDAGDAFSKVIKCRERAELNTKPLIPGGTHRSHTSRPTVQIVRSPFVSYHRLILIGL